MDKSTLKYLWNQIWWGLSPKKEIIDFFKSYGMINTPEYVIVNHYNILQKKKDRIISLTNFDTTHFAKLNSAFNILNQEGIISIHYAGSTMSDGIQTAHSVSQDIHTEVVSDKLEFDLTKIKGYCFYHEQDIEGHVPDLDGNSIPQKNLYLTFGRFHSNERYNQQKIAQKIVDVLNEKNLNCDWNGDPNSRIILKDFIWIKKEDEFSWDNEVLNLILGNYQKSKIINSNLLKIGLTIKIIQGPFENFEGVITNINVENKTLAAEVEVLGRTMLVELDYNQVGIK